MLSLERRLEKTKAAFVKARKQQSTDDQIREYYRKEVEKLITTKPSFMKYIFNSLKDFYINTFGAAIVLVLAAPALMGAAWLIGVAVRTIVEFFLLGYK